MINVTKKVIAIAPAWLTPPPRVDEVSQSTGPVQLS